MKFILDIDGVMVHANPHRTVELDEDGFYKFNAIAVKILTSVLNLSGDNELILSTSHRFRYTINEWKIIFLHRGIPVNNLSIIGDKLQYQVSRKNEIENWIKKNRIKSQEVIIIDDDKSLNDLPKNLKSRLVLTNSYTGLNNYDVFTEVLKIDTIIFNQIEDEKTDY